MKKHVCLALIILTSLVSPALAAASGKSIAELIQAYERPEIGDGVAVSNLTFSSPSGNLKFNLSAGRAAAVSVAGEPIGVFFVGRASFTYVSTDPVEHAALEYNTEHATSLTAATNEAGNVLLEGPVEQLFLWIAGSELPQLPDGETQPLDPSFAEHREQFGKAQIPPPAHLFVKQTLDDPGATVIWAEFISGPDNLVYVWDSVYEEAAALYCLRADHRYPGQPDMLWPVLLSQQAIDRDRRDFKHPSFLLTDVTYTLTASKKSDAAFDITETLLPQRQAQRVLRFDLTSRVYDRHNKPRLYNVRGVTDAAGKALSYHHDQDQLVVDLAQPAEPDQAIKLRFEIDGDFLILPQGDSYWQLGSWSFPQPEWSGRHFTVHSTVRVEKPFVPLVPGVTISRREEGEYNVVENKLDKPVSFYIIIAGRYRLEEEKEGDVTIRVASYAGGNPRAFRKLGHLASQMIQYYESWLGPFPFTEYNIIEINSLGWGQAPPATMFITQEAFTPQMNKIFTQGINHRFAHEIAHQYWGYVVREGSFEDEWLAESFAEFSSALAIKELKGEVAFKDMISDWKSDAKASLNRATMPTANRIRSTTPSSSWDRINLIYDKGAYILACLYEELGDQKFRAFLRVYLKGLAWKFGTTKDVVNLLEAITKKDYDSFFERYYWGTELPTMKDGN